MGRVSVEKMRELLQVYFIAGTPNVSTSIVEVLQQAIEGGISMFQFREKGNGALEGNEKEKLARELLCLCQKANIPFIVNDDVELALKIGADGVHIGQEDGNVEEIRQLIGDRILGVSAHNELEARKALEQGADYLGVGPVFATSTKKDTEKVCGPDFISTLRARGINAPIVAIGGIKLSNASEVVKGGADGLSVITAISFADDPALVAAEFKKVWVK
ncbi:MAG: thiamine phosphate synthase [Bacillaceae bacterium]|nr:thiamine phosphate synthase [Bacillaceae bacterium]